MDKKYIYKPKTTLYKNVIDITQTLTYTPQKESWFCEVLQADAEQVREALDYLCFTHYLYRLEDASYGVDYDFRLCLRGIYHSDGKNGHVHPDVQRRIRTPVFVPKKWSMGAQHNDRVEIAMEGEVTFGGVGAVHRIINTWGDYAVGRLYRMDGSWVVFPDAPELGNFIPVSALPIGAQSNRMVLIKLNHAEEIRGQQLKKADIRQKKQSITWEKIQGGYKENLLTENIPSSCTVLKYLKNDRERFMYKYGLQPELSAAAEKEVETPVKRAGKPNTRVNLTGMRTLLLSPERAVTIEKIQDAYKILVHVADVSESISLHGALEQELLRKCWSKELVPAQIQQSCGFVINETQNAITISFCTDGKGSLSDCTVYRSVICPDTEEHLLYDTLVKTMPVNSMDENPVICAANDAVAVWFDQEDEPAPFVTVRYMEESNMLFQIAEQHGWKVKGNTPLEKIWSVLKNAKQQNAFDAAERLLMPAFCIEADVIAREGMTTDFCRPFTSYLSILSQYCFVKALKNKRRSEKNALYAVVREKTAQYNYRRLCLEYYHIICRNITIDKQLRRGESCKAIYVAEANNGYSLYFCNGTFGLCKDSRSRKQGEIVQLIYEDISLDRLDMFYRLNETE